MKHKKTYGLNRPMWYVKWRGERWLKQGYCPVCYSSPPQHDCPICAGNHNYGPNLKPVTRVRWRLRWDKFKKEM